MRNIKGILLSLFFAMWLEFFYKFGATYDPQNFIGALLIYPVYIGLLFVLFKSFKIQSKALIYLIGGFVGLMAEWFIIGNAPWNNPDAFQLGMYVFHAFYPAYGYLYSKNRLEVREQRLVLRLFGFFTVLSVAGFIIPHQDFRFIYFIFVPLMAYFIYAARLVMIIYLDLRKKRP